MLYKSIVMELLLEQPELYELLRSSKRLLPAMDAYATELKAMHDTWMSKMWRVRPESDSTQISSEAAELAIEHLRQTLQAESPTSDAGPLSLEGAMAYLKRHTPPA